MNIDAIKERMDDFRQQKKEIEDAEKTLEERIEDLIQELDAYSDSRKTINTLKHQKDRLILEYIELVKQPELLDIGLINYKALYFYFKANFIEVSDKFLSFEDYNNNLDRIQLANKTKFEKAFGEDNRIYLDIKATNFPHLIGFKQDDKDEFGSYDNTKNREFLNNIYYETNLLEDYSDHGCDIDKIKTVSWIWNTLKKPLYVFQQDAIDSTKSNLKTDLLFVKKVKTDPIGAKGTYHYVSLIKIQSSCKNKYVINSHHPMTEDEFRVKYNTNKAIYQYNFS